MGTEHTDRDRGPEDRGHALAKLRGILVSSLSRENLSAVDVERQESSSSSDSPPQPPTRQRRKVRFSESQSVDSLSRGIKRLPTMYAMSYSFQQSRLFPSFNYTLFNGSVGRPTATLRKERQLLE